MSNEIEKRGRFSSPGAVIGLIAVSVCGLALFACIWKFITNSGGALFQ